MQKHYDLFPNTEYRLRVDDSTWAFCKDVYNEGGTFLFAEGYQQHFPMSELNAWLNEGIIKPVCGICNKSTVHLSEHLTAFHSIKVYG